MRLRTVRAKLTALVSLPIVVTLASMPVLSTVLQNQLLDEADDKVEAAEKAFREELKDSILDLRLASTIIATDSDTGRAFAAHDAKSLTAIGAECLRVYPDIDILFIDPTGKLAGQVGCEHPPTDVAAFPDVLPVMRGTEVSGMTAHGCEATPDAPPSYMIASPVAGGGAVIVCMPLNRAYLDNAGAKFGLRLAMLEVGSNEIVQASEGFPPSAVIGELDTSVLVEHAGQTLAVRRWNPKNTNGPGKHYSLIASLDVTEIKNIVRGNLLKVAVVLLAAAAISVLLGYRLASLMANALKRVNDGLKKLEKNEYVHVLGIKTGDELEDLAAGFNSMVDGLKERDKLRTTMGKYMTQTVVDHLLSGKVQLGGASIPVTILFTDIRSFTTISEKMDAQALVGLLNEYFTEMVGIVMDSEGVVDKYIGDAIMAVFGAPVPKKDDAVNAVRAAVRMRKALAHLNDRLKERGLAPLRTGIGIHTGEVVAGNIGSERRMEYTVIGDAVNLASRLESNTKDLGVNVLISEDTYRLVKDAIDARPMKEITVKGRHQPVMTYEVLGIKGEEPLAVSDSTKLARSQPPPAVTSAE